MARSFLAAAAALAAVAVSSTTVAAQTGMTASLSAAGGQYVLDALIPILVAKIDKIVIPDISGEKDGFDYSLSGFTCTGFTIGAGALTMSPADGLQVDLANLGISCAGSWSFKLSIWPHIPDGSGTVTGSMSGTTAALGLDITTAAGGHAQLAPNNVNLNIGSFSLDFHGSLWDWLLDLFKGLIEDAATSAITSAFKSAITDFITNDANPALAAIAMELPLHLPAPYDIVEVRFGLTANPTFTSTYMGVALQGDVVPIANPVSPPITPPALPPFNAATAAYYLQLQLSSYTFMSALYDYDAAGLLFWALPSTKIPLGFNDTSAYSLVAPGLPAAYPHDPVAINIAFSAMPTLDLSPAGINITAPLLMQFLVTAANGTTATAFTLGALTTLTADLVIGPDSTGATALKGSLSYLGAQLSVVNSTVGTVASGLLQTLVDMTFTGVVVPLVNSIFANGIPLPSVDGLTLTNTSLTYGAEFFTLASDFTFAPNFTAATAHSYFAQRDGSVLVRPAGATTAAPRAHLRHPHRKH